MRKEVEKAARVLLSMQRMAWEQGLAAQAFFECGDPLTGTLMVDEAIHRTHNKLMGAVYTASDSVDCGSNGLPAWYAWKYTGNESYRKAVCDMADWYRWSAPKTADGQIIHDRKGSRTMIDGIYHLVPVLILGGYPDYAVEQIRLFHARHYDQKSGLYRQVWNEGTRSFERADLWGGGQGWMACAIALACRFLPAEKKEYCSELSVMLNRLIDSMEKYLRKDGMFHDVMDDPSTFPEVTAGLMLTYSVYVGIAEKAVPAERKELADRILQLVSEHVDENGYVNDACASPYFNYCGHSAEAQAFFMLCMAEKEKLEEAL